MVHLCTVNCALNNKIKHSVSLLFRKKHGTVCLEYSKLDTCDACKKKINIDVSLLFDPIWLYVQTNQNNSIYATEVPKVLQLSNSTFQFLCATIHYKNHFRSIFYLNSSYYLVDDLVKKNY